MAACSKNNFQHPDPGEVPAARATVRRPNSLSKRLAPPVLCVLAGLTACSKQDFPQYPPNYREYAYITNGDSGTVTVLDAVNVRIDREIPVGRDPVGVIASPTRNEVYVLNAGADNSAGSLSVIDSKKNAVVATIALGRRPVSIDLDADGALAYVANSGSNSISICSKPCGPMTLRCAAPA